MPTTRARRRWCHFTLRSLFLLTLLVALGLGWFTTELRRARSQTEAVETLFKSDGYVGYRYAFGKKWGRRLDSFVGEGFLAYVVAVAYADESTLTNCGARRTTDAGLAPLVRSLTSLPHTIYSVQCERLPIGRKYNIAHVPDPTTTVWFYNEAAMQDAAAVQGTDILAIQRPSRTAKRVIDLL